MHGTRSVLILAAVTLVAVGAVFFVERESGTVDHGGGVVFPALLGQVNSVERVRVTGREGAFTLARAGDRWVVEEKERYVADPDRVHKLLLGGAGMRRVEPKTSNPDLYPKLWLEDPSGEDSKSVRFVLENASGTALADWVLGDSRPSKSDAARTELFIRVADDPLAWLVEGSVPGGSTIIDWIDRAVARIERERLRDVEVVHADGAVVAVNRPDSADTDFSLQGVPAGRETDSQYRVNDIGRFLEDLRFEDVARSSSLDFSGSVDKRLRITTFDGLRVDVESVMRDGEAWVKLRAEADESLVATSGAGAGASGGDDVESTKVSGALLALDDVRAEAERLNARWKGWAYELPSFKRDYIARRMDELTRAIEASEAADEDGSTS